MKLLGIIAGLIVLLVVFFRLSFYDIHVRYRLTVEVQDGEQIKSGSSVVEALYNIEPSWSPSHTSGDVRIVGSEPTVDLGRRGMVFLTFGDALRTPTQIVERNSHVGCGGTDMYCLPFEAYGTRRLVRVIFR